MRQMCSSEARAGGGEAVLSGRPQRKAAAAVLQVALAGKPCTGPGSSSV